MLNYLLKRLAALVPMLIGITMISFAVIHVAPGSPADLLVQMNPKASPEAKARLRAYYGLDKPLHIQYLYWLKQIAVFDFGSSFAPDGRKVADKILERLPVTVLINLLSMLLIFSIALPLGVLSSVYQRSLFDKFSTVFVFLGFAWPSFWLALLLMMLFGITLGWLPISGLKAYNHDSLSFLSQTLDYAQHLILPVLVSAFGGMAGMSRYVRSSMLEVIRQDYIRTARAKGLTETAVIYRHALRNALLPVITLLGLSVPGLIGGSVIFETIFSIPGMGQLFWQSAMSRDYPLIMGMLVIGALLTLIGNILADISYAIADPRIRVK
jgi:peptide/nickel transport system permease protein